MRLCVLLALLLFPLAAQADELRVTINMATGSEPLRYSLTAEQTRSFWHKWRRLNDSATIVPLPAGNSYGGLTLYDAERSVEVRLYNGFGRSGNVGKTDDYRQLERWVLGFAPPPLGPALIRALDESVRAQPGGAQAMPAEKLNSEQVINACRRRAGRDARLKALCLQERLLEQLDNAEYAKALEAIAREKLMPPAAGPDGSR